MNPPLFISRHLFLLNLTLSLLLLAPLTRAADDAPHLGWIPIQTIPAETSTTLDLTRWLSPGPAATVQINPPASLSAQLEPSTLQLKIQTQPDLQGLIDLPIQITPKKGEPLSGILTLAISPRSSHRFIFTGKGS